MKRNQDWLAHGAAYGDKHIKPSLPNTTKRRPQTQAERTALLDKIEADLRKKFGDRIIIRRGDLKKKETIKQEHEK